MYKTPIQLVSILFIVIGVYMAGSIANEEAWLAKVKELIALGANLDLKNGNAAFKFT